MMNKTYLNPTMVVVKLQHSSIICASNGNIVSSINGNAGLNYGGGGSGDARTKESSNIWDEEW